MLKTMLQPVRMQLHLNSLHSSAYFDSKNWNLGILKPLVHRQLKEEDVLQNHRIVGVGKDLRSSGSAPLLKYLQRWRLYNLSVHDLCHWPHSEWKNVSCCSEGTSCFSLCPLPLLLSLSSTEIRLNLFSLHLPLRYLYTLMTSPLSLSPGWTVSALSAFSHRKVVLVPQSSWWLCTGMSLECSNLFCTGKHHRCGGLSSAE